MVLASFVVFSFTFGFGTWQDPWIWYVGFSIYSCSRKRKKRPPCDFGSVGRLASSLHLLIYFSCISVCICIAFVSYAYIRFCGHTNTTTCMHVESWDSLQESVLSFSHVVPRIELRWSGLGASAFVC